ncbi:DEAD-box ATP-dependent RNA helicase 26 [Psilocybe cubensis]|uniref:DEAD-box ATP-dependent RNA helicase 26 n=2 Tax=Psilocybe cubensis TaxID=181762 RepID=A0ACB8GW60_PSICU|nr:DEAD-box ATP-dependent RNA helicase 26 [Psilocybe cubensis]KAH9479672.1 DEAD-box ATP-dependent RNA helicase 26 [Psilocybe cubensis]
MSLNTETSNSNTRGRSYRPRRGGSGHARGRGQARHYPSVSEEVGDGHSATFAGGKRGFTTTATVTAAAAAAVRSVAAKTTKPPVEARSATPTTNNRHFSERRFADAPISSASKAGIKHEFMSDVQAATLDVAMEGHDLLVQARTGTGKTVAFLLPSIERLIKMPKTDKISMLVLAPTRELALQIEEEAKVLLAQHHLTVGHAIGGTNPTTEAARILNRPCDILIATPGRLIDHLRSTTLKEKLTGLKIMVYDEADRLLDQGFRPDLETIAKFLPPRQTRQALLFSATVSNEIKQIAAGALRPGYKFISTLLEDEVNTHEHVEQTYMITPQEKFLGTAIDILKQDLMAHLSATMSTSKCMVFFPTARHVSFAAEVFKHIEGLPPVLEIHSRKSQPARIRAAEDFKKAPSAILLSSDVAARGVDFPGVTLVLQVGLPSSAEQYVHRLGRTARAGASGRGILILSSEEQSFLSKAEVAELGLKPSTPPPSRTSISHALAQISPEIKSQAYRAFLGFYNSYTKSLRMSKEALVQWANHYAFNSLGWPARDGPPGIDPRTLGKMGLRGVKGVKEEKK